MFDLQVEGADLIADKLQQVKDKLDLLGKETMPEQLVVWQTEDMNRKYPNIQKPDEKTAFTLIWPRSRLSGQRERTRGQRARAFSLRNLVIPRPRVVTPAGSTRPILREVLFGTLCLRMRTLLQVTMEWPKNIK